MERQKKVEGMVAISAVIKIHPFLGSGMVGPLLHDSIAVATLENSGGKKGQYSVCAPENAQKFDIFPILDAFY